MLAVALLHTFIIRQGTLVMDTAKEAALFTGFNEKTVSSFLTAGEGLRAASRGSMNATAS